MSRPAPATYEVWRTPTAETDHRNARADIQREIEQFEAELGVDGCEAAHYRLAGQIADRLCCRHLSRRSRVIVGFPTADEVCLVMVDQHVPGATGVYERFYRLAGISMPTEPRGKPECCEQDGGAPVDQEVVDRLVAGARRLRRRS